MDRIKQILDIHLEAAERILELLEKGVRIDLPGDDQALIPSTREEVLLRIENLKAAIARHEDRNATRT